MTAIGPGNCLPPQPEAFLRAHSSVHQHGGHGRQGLGCRRQIAGIFFGHEYALSVAFARKHPDLSGMFNYAPLDCKAKHTAQDLQLSIDT
jgi:hypothetical protein